MMLLARLIVDAMLLARCHTFTLPLLYLPLMPRRHATRFARDADAMMLCCCYGGAFVTLSAMFR